MEEELDYKKTILIVDDEKMILNLLAHNLEKEGYNVIEASDGLEAVNFARCNASKIRWVISMQKNKKYDEYSYTYGYSKR